MANESSIAAFNRQFAVPGIAQIDAGNGRLPRIQIVTRSATADIYLHGAQVTSWQPAGTSEVIFVSRNAQWEDGKAIRGGIPVCFPWFRAKSDDSKAPMHGFVRTKEWQVDSISIVDEDAVCVRLWTASDEASRKWWPFEFRLEYAITIGKMLELELAMRNTGRTALRFEEALHTYFRVSDARKVAVRGLDGLKFLDNRDGNAEKTQAGELIPTKQTDNAYINATGPAEIVDSARRLTTEKLNSDSTIVWNPWSDGAAKMADFGADEWASMLCVEGGNIMDAAVTLEPGQSHTMRVSIRVSANPAS
jgi:glucose-6-phosphate 1-epimerase